MMKSFCLVGVMLAGFAAAEAVNSEKSLNLSGTWKLRQADATEWLPIIVPGGVHDALLAAGKIPDPYFGQNELAVQWVGQKDWIIERSFDVPADLLAKKSVILRLTDVDTFCKISINGQTVGETANRFRRYDFDVKPLLKVGANTLTGYFKSSEAMSYEFAKHIPRPLPMSGDGLIPHINLIRTAICHGGWDWGISLLVTGFAGQTELIGTDLARIDAVFCDQKHAPGTCEVTVHTFAVSPTGGATTYAIDLGGVKSEKTVTLQPGTNHLAATVSIDRPRLWWPNGAGEQHLYDLKVAVGTATLERKLGLRTIAVINQADRDPKTGKEGASMAFRVNGVDIFCKGADWIPCDAFEGRQTPARYRDLLASAATANMNMVRLWGGGQFEHDCFYECCDELGLLIWHDFMFSCALYPDDPAFLDQIRAEIGYQIPRLRDHASIALWCGDNECIGALNWWEPPRKNRAVYLAAYNRVNRILADGVATNDPGRTFWPSSPCGGPGDFSDCWHNDAKGDMHFWSVWHENKDFSAYYSVKPRFCSEFGFQSFSSPEVAATFCKPEQMNPTAPDFEYHQKNRGGNGRILATMTRYFRFPVGIDNVLYLSQVQQAMAIKTAVEAWRHLQPHCMGTIFWQLNDDWPVASWSSLEYGGKWKHLQYAAKRFYAPLTVMATPADDDSNMLEVWALNDEDEPVAANVQLATWTFAGKVAATESIAVKLPPRSSTRVGRYPLAHFGDQAARLNRFLSLELAATVKGQPVVYRNDWMFNYYKACELADAKVTLTAAEKDGAYTVTLATDAPAFFVWVNAAGIHGEFSDNSFTLYPGQPVTLTFTPKGPTTFAAFQKALRVKHLRQTY